MLIVVFTDSNCEDMCISVVIMGKGSNKDRRVVFLSANSTNMSQ